MKIPELKDDLNIISKLGDNPGADNGLTAEGLKAKFDEGSLTIQQYINSVLIAKLNEIFKSIMKNIIIIIFSYCDFLKIIFFIKIYCSEIAFSDLKRNKYTLTLVAMFQYHFNQFRRNFFVPELF